MKLWLASLAVAVLFGVAALLYWRRRRDRARRAADPDAAAHRAEVEAAFAETRAWVAEVEAAAREEGRGR